MKDGVILFLILMVGFSWNGGDAVSAQESVLQTIDFSGLEKPFYEKMFSNFFHDPTGNTLALIVLLGMVFSLVGVGYHFLKTTRGDIRKWPEWIMPILSLIRLAVAGYLSFLALTPVEAVCGPVGDCDAVQQSPYAHLFGVIHVSFLGFIAYLVILTAWLIQHYGPASWKQVGALTVWGMALVGTLFSIYLTFLEPFVIGVTCIWCVTSAIVITLLLWGSTLPAKHAWKNINSSTFKV